MSVVSTDTDIPDDIEYYYTDNSAASSVVNEKDEEEAKKVNSELLLSKPRWSSLMTHF